MFHNMASVVSLSVYMRRGGVGDLFWQNHLDFEIKHQIVLLIFSQLIMS